MRFNWRQIKRCGRRVMVAWYSTDIYGDMEEPKQVVFYPVTKIEGDLKKATEPTLSLNPPTVEVEIDETRAVEFPLDKLEVETSGGPVNWSRYEYAISPFEPPFAVRIELEGVWLTPAEVGYERKRGRRTRWLLILPE